MSSCGTIRATAPRLPVELQDEIIEYLRGDHQSLSACSLTCKSWLQKSRALLFRKIKRELSNSTEDDEYYLLDFAEFLCENTAIAAEIHDLELSQFYSFGSPVFTLAGELSPVVKCLPNLRKLTLNRFKLSSEIREFEYHPPLHADDGIALFQAIAQLPHLHTLEMSLFMRCERPFDESIFSPGSFSQLKSLKLGTRRSDDTNIAPAILAATARSQCTPRRESDRPHLRKLTLPEYTDLMVPIFGQYSSFFETAGEFLEELEFTLMDNFASYSTRGTITARESMESMHVGLCKNLNTLTFMLDAPDAPDSWLVVLATLAAIPSQHHPRLVVIDFSVTEFLPEPPPHTLGELDQAFDSTSSVEEVIIRTPLWDEQGVIDKYCKDISAQLPNLISKGLFRIEVSDFIDT